MPVGQIGNPYGAFGEPTAQGSWSGCTTIEAQNRTSVAIQAGQWVKATITSSSFYPAGYTIKPCTGNDGASVIGVAAEQISAIPAVTATTGSVPNIQPQDYSGTVVTYGVVYAAFPPGANGPGTQNATPNFLVPATTFGNGVVGATSVAGIAMASSTAVLGQSTLNNAFSVSTSTSIYGPGNFIGVALVGSSVGLTAAGSTTLYPVFVCKY